MAGWLSLAEISVRARKLCLHDLLNNYMNGYHALITIYNLIRILLSFPFKCVRFVCGKKNLHFPVVLVCELTFNRKFRVNGLEVFVLAPG